ncbi:pyridoxal-phosphate-dependent aminotransferase family protein [Aestuariibius sp. 2305UL40-4]|uniref:pyridoxal-phosphate-dependent aminotransferase family protein n=1 Tax=Aestuariibius violaceus TaxID=3234132 RepID=UPI00345F0B97
MSLAHGHHYLAIPGPSVIPDRVQRAMHRASPNIYEGELHEITRSVIPDLKRVARTEAQVALYIGNGHAAWEAALANVTSPGDRVLVLATGRFGHGWSEMARTLGLEPQILDFGEESDVDPARVEEALKADREGRIKAVLSVFVDTSTSVLSDVGAVRQAIDNAGHSALLMCDCIASLGCDRFEMDDWGVDVTVTGCQKGLMTPPGMSFVFFNEKAEAARESAQNVTHYWDWQRRTGVEEYYQYFDGTAPTHHLYGLREALDMIFEEGLEAVWARHRRLAGAIWAAGETWAQEGPMRLNVKDISQRSCAVTSVGIGEGNGDRLRAFMEHEMGVTLGIGLGRDPSSAWFRIGHMGHVNAHMVMGLLGCIETGLSALQIPHGRGALDAAAEALV